MKKRETIEKENGNILLDHSDLVRQLNMMSRCWKFDNIQDEERRVTIEGYVFDTEVRELRSGRSLLTIKVTDYTDSILVKMFSRDNEDAEMMKTLKKGAWVRARVVLLIVMSLFLPLQQLSMLVGLRRIDTAPPSGFTENNAVTSGR